MTTRRVFRHRETRAEKNATRDRAILTLLAAGFTVPELVAALGIGRSRVYGVLAELSAIRGGPIGPDARVVAAVSAFLEGRGEAG